VGATSPVLDKRLVHALGRLVLEIEEDPPYGEWKWHHHDHLMSTRLVTGWSGQAATAQRLDFTPFGAEMPDGDGACHEGRYALHERDGETGLTYMLARYQSPWHARLLEADPARASISVQRPQTWSRFGYAGNNPLLRLDPNGLDDLQFDANTTAEVYPADVMVIGTTDAEGNVRPTHVASYQEQGPSGEPLGYENTVERNQDLTQFPTRDATTDPDNTGRAHPLVDVSQASVNGKPNPYSSANGAVLVGIVPAGRAVSTEELSQAAQGIAMSYGDEQCTDFTWTLSNAAGAKIRVEYSPMQSPNLVDFARAIDPARVTRTP
jgi:RHS repeat-associated protein